MPSNTHGIYPHSRLRRLRDKAFMRQLVQETSLLSHDLIMPLFVVDKPKHKEAIPSMPNIYRLGFAEVTKECEKAVKLEIPALILFPVIEKHLRSLEAKEAYNENGLIPRMISHIKTTFPELGVITDIALDPYTTHGHDGLLDESGNILGDATVRILKQQALSHAAAGVDIVAPSDMMDGRIGAIREGFEIQGFPHTKILSYSAKFASSLYKPFRHCLSTLADTSSSLASNAPTHKRSYQLGIGNAQQALREAAQDIHEGADILMVKPATCYGDIIHNLKTTYSIPIFGYHVSGEYSMIKAAAGHGWIEEKPAVMECMLSLKRAGCSAIITYYALELATWLKNLHTLDY